MFKKVLKRLVDVLSVSNGEVPQYVVSPQGVLALTARGYDVVQRREQVRL